MRCPYCVSEISDQALACPHCAHDLYLFKPLLEKVSNAEARVAALEAELAELKAQQAKPVVVEVAPLPPRAPSGGYGAALTQALIPVVVLLIVAHWALLFTFDVKPLYLRIASILIPLPFGYLLATRHPGRLWSSAGAGFFAAALAVFGMLVVTAVIDKVPVLPHEAREWRETLEYVASIGLAFTTGAMLGEFMPAFREKGSPPHRVMLLLSRALVPDEEGTLGIEKAAKKIDKMVKAATPVATGAASVYAGVKVFLGGLG